MKNDFYCKSAGGTIFRFLGEPQFFFLMAMPLWEWGKGPAINE